VCPIQILEEVLTIPTDVFIFFLAVHPRCVLNNQRYIRNSLKHKHIFS
jgi:hypothetical protein